MTADELRENLAKEKELTWQIMREIQRADQQMLAAMGYRGMSQEAALIKCFRSGLETIERKLRKWERENPQ